jgi:DNA primase
MTLEMEDLLDELGVRLGHSTAHEVFGLCPGHKENLGREDRTPKTWSVSRYTGAHYCFSCGFGGSMPELIMKLSKRSYWDALKLMREYDIDPADPDDLPKTYRPKGKVETFKTMPDHTLQVFGPPPEKELRRRKISLEAAAHYDVLWDDEVPCWICPIKLLGGALLGWQAKGKGYFDNYPESVPKSQTCFGIDKFEPGTTAILMESPLDAPHLWTEGFDGGLASFGVGVSDDQLRLILSLTDKLLLALDNDEEGERWTRRIITGDLGPKKPRGTAWGTKFNLEVINYKKTKAKDPGEMTGEQLEWALENAIHSTEYV